MPAPIVTSIELLEFSYTRQDVAPHEKARAMLYSPGATSTLKARAIRIYTDAGIIGGPQFRLINRTLRGHRHI